MSEDSNPNLPKHLRAMSGYYARLYSAGLKTTGVGGGHNKRMQRLTFEAADEIDNLRAALLVREPEGSSK